MFDTFNHIISRELPILVLWVWVGLQNSITVAVDMVGPDWLKLHIITMAVEVLDVNYSRCRDGSLPPVQFN